MTGEEMRPDGGAVVERTESSGVAGEPAVPTDESPLECEEVVLGYPESDPVIDGESVSIPQGRVTALVGPNGSGKSTLLRGLSNQHQLDGGVVRLDGRAIQSLDTKEVARKLGLLSQENVSPGSLSVRELVMHGRYPHRGFFDSRTDEDECAVADALSLAGVDHLADREVGGLSGGQKQLAWIAMVLAQDTDILLLDEPTTFLDLHHQLEVMEIVEALKADAEVTVVLVLHDIDQAARYADHVLALDDGSIYARGPPEEVVTEDLLHDVFGVAATVEHTDRGPRVTAHDAVHDADGNDLNTSS